MEGENNIVGRSKTAIIIFTIIWASMGLKYLGTTFIDGCIFIILGLICIYIFILIVRACRYGYIVERWKEKKRNNIITATVTKIENGLMNKSQIETSSLECVGIDSKGKRYKFHVNDVIGKFIVKEGETVQVKVEQNNWKNYQIMLNNIVK